MTNSPLKMRIQDDRKNAMRNQDKQRLGVIQLMMAAVKQWEVDERKEMTDQQMLLILDKMVKQRRDSITQFQAGNRQDLADKESYELQVIQEYLPTALSVDEISNMIKSAIAQTGAQGQQDMGKVMAILKPQIQGRADMGAVSAQIKQLLTPTG
jgi:uncharacterized protein YqeY